MPKLNREDHHRDVHVVMSLGDHKKEADNADSPLVLTGVKEAMNVVLWGL